MTTEPAHIVNRSLDAIGSPVTIGSIFDGTTESEAARRIYTTALLQLLRASHWSFSRKRGPLTLLGDSTGQTQNVGTIVEAPWIYCYAWPNDAVCARWLPWSGLPPSALAIAGGPPIPGNIQPPNPAVPITPNLNVPSIPLYPYERPARFLLSNTDQYPSQIGPYAPDFDATQGVGPVSRRIILTNVPQAQFVYTYLAAEIEVWDSLFDQAMVSVLASQLAMKVLRDPKLAIAERNAHIAIAKDAIRQARVSSDNEAGFRQSTDHQPDWLRVRRLGGFGRWGAGGFDGFGGGGGPGVYGYGWESFSFADGSVY
jgi:hypothetical protein